MPPLLLRPDEEEDRQGGEKTAEEGKTFGCLVIEQMSTGELSPRLKQRVDLVTGHVAAALHAARTQERIFGLRLWRTIGGLREWLVGRKLIKTLIALGLVLLVTLAMVLIPWDYRVSGEGRLMPVRQEHVFPPWEGDVVELFVEGGELVKEGDKLLRIRNKELESEKVRIDTELTRNPNCGDPPSQTDPRTYTVREIYNFEGQTVFAARSPLGALWIYDQKPGDHERAWLVEVFDYSRPQSISTFIAETVAENDLTGLETLTSVLPRSGPLATAE